MTRDAALTTRLQSVADKAEERKCVKALQAGVRPEQVTGSLVAHCGVVLSGPIVPRWPAWVDKAERAKADFDRSYREVQLTLAADVRPAMEALARAAAAASRYQLAARPPSRWRSLVARVRSWLAS